jgi:uncharacterized protein (TIGR00369 family)
MWKTVKGDSYLLLPNSEKNSCFGCSPRNPSGLEMEFYTNEGRDSVVSWYSVHDRFCGWGDVVHGGIVSTILDEAMGWACIALVRKLLLSKSIAVDFLRPVRSGKEIRVEGSVREIVSDREAVMQGCIYDDHDEICARASSIVSLFTLDAARKTGTIDEELLRSFERTMNAGY